MAGLERTMPGMHPVLAAWFAGAFGEPTDVQRRSWEAVMSGSHALIAAPTGSGKTLAALLPCLSRLLEEKEAASGTGDKGKNLPASTDDRFQAKGVRILYITPLKALNNDIHHHVLGFVEQLDRVAAEAGLAWPGIRSAVRTGDTKPSERAAMLRRPPDVLVTTPESLYMLLTSDKGREALRTVRQVVVDEIHSLAADKRGTHLSLSLERLTACCGQDVQRIGVSATQKPLERVARYLGGWEDAGPGPRNPLTVGDALYARGQTNDSSSSALSADESGTGSEAGFMHPLGLRPRPVRIVESDMVKQYAVVATMPDQSRQLQTRDAAVWLPLLERLTALMSGSRSVLIYVNSRRLCERLCLRLNDHYGYEIARAHHGSMSREWRLEVERMLKSGALKCIVATASLELGIDVGHVDFVIQIDPPPEAAAGIQRMGRAGHAVGDTSRGAIIARNKGALPDIAVLSRMIAERDIEEIVVPRDALDVLAQQIVAMTVERDWMADELYRLIARSDSYRAFPRTRLDALLDMLSGFYPFVRPLLDWDRESGLVSSRANSRMAAISGAGTIPQSSAYPVHHADSRAQIGELDEEFIHESRVGDVVQLGAQAWTIREIKQDRVYATEAGNRFSEIPFWRNETPARSYELGMKIGAFMRVLEDRLEQADAETIEWLEQFYGLDAYAAAELIDYARAQQAACGIPTDRRIVIEHYKDASGQKHVHIHNHYGRKINRTWLMAIERHFADLVPYRIYGNAKDGGIELVFSEWDVSWLHAIWQVTADNVQALLTEALAGSPLLSVSFRRMAETSLLLARSFTRVPLWQKRLRSAELLKRALPYADRFPLFQEAMREAMQDFLDLERLRGILEQLADGRMETIVRETATPSPLAGQFLFEYVNMRMYEGDGLDESVQLQLMQFSKSMAGEVFRAEDGGALQSVDPSIISEEQERLLAPAFALRHADDLLQAIKQRGDLTVPEITQLAGDAALAWLEQLLAERKVAEWTFDGRTDARLIAADERKMYEEFPSSGASIAFVLGRFADHRLSFTEPELMERYPALQGNQAAAAVQTLLDLDLIEQAPFASDSAERIWTSRKVAERLVRLSINKARQAIAPIDADRWLGDLLERQLVRPSDRPGDHAAAGETALLAVIARLQGIYLPLSHWETIILPARLPQYRRETLDMLCASGQVCWLGRKEKGEKEGKVAFFLAESHALYEPWLLASRTREADTKHPQLLEQLKTGGARFLTRLSQETGRLPSELLADLLDLVWEGHVSNDQFAPLRQQTGGRGKARSFAKTGSGLGRWYWTGSLLADVPAASEHAGDAFDEHRHAGPVQADHGRAGRAFADHGRASTEPGDHEHVEIASVDHDHARTASTDHRHTRSASADLNQSAADARSSPIVHWVHHLLQTYGVLTKELAVRMSPYSWETLLPALRQLETWGAVTRGMFIRDLPVLQFSTRELAAEMRKPLPSSDTHDVSLLSAVDPANPFGLAVDWPAVDGAAFARKPGNYLLLQENRWLYWIENGGRRIYEMTGSGPDEAEADGKQELQPSAATAPDPSVFKAAFQLLLRQHGSSRIAIERWNGSPVLDSAAADGLRSIGAERDRDAFVLWASALR